MSSSVSSTASSLCNVSGVNSTGLFEPKGIFRDRKFAITVKGDGNLDENDRSELSRLIIANINKTIFVNSNKVETSKGADRDTYLRLRTNDNRNASNEAYYVYNFVKSWFRYEIADLYQLNDNELALLNPKTIKSLNVARANQIPLFQAANSVQKHLENPSL